MRLIDADELKNQISGLLLPYDNNLEFVLNKINIAPTVCGNNPKWCESCVSKGKCASTRPQGEWVFLKANEEQTNGYECSVCKRTYHTRVPYFSEYNYCPNCGAQMVGGGENE